jgi:predicted component of type VI protein secretion system
MKAELVPENGDPPIPIVRDLTLLGRHQDCDVVIEHSSLSKRHCLLVKTDGLLVIRDLATTNGTKVKGQRVRWAALLPEDRVSFGAYKMRIYLGSDEMPSPSEQRQVRNGGTRSRAPAVVAQGGAGLYPSLKKTELTPPTQAPRVLPSSFPEPSHDGTAAAEWDRVYASGVPQPAAAAEPALLNGGFEIIDDEPGAGAGGAGVFEAGFEIVEDEDDDIIELD